MKIKSLEALQIINSRGIPTIKTFVVLENGIQSEASVPQGASVGKLEVKELRDNEKNQFLGNSVGKSVHLIENGINDALKGQEIENQAKIDKILIDLDGTKDKSKIGANTLLSVSLACARAAAKSKNIELFQYLGEFTNNKKFLLPIPLFNLINGGKHAGNNLDIQEFLIIPNKTFSFFESVRAGVEIYLKLKQILEEKQLNTNLGDEGGFAPELENNKEALNLLKEAREITGNKEKVVFGLDVAASSFYDENLKQYVFENTALTSDQFISYLKEIAQEFDIKSLEDPLSDTDLTNWSKVKKEIPEIQIVGDDLFVTNEKLVKERSNLATAIIVKPNQIGTLSETLTTIAAARANNLKLIISHRSGETEDSFIADLAVGVGAEMIKSGSLARSERLVKYNRLLEIERFFNLEYSQNL